MADAISYKLLDYTIPNSRVFVPCPIIEVTRDDGSKYRFADLHSGFIQSIKSWYSPSNGKFPCAYYRGNSYNSTNLLAFINNNIGPHIGESGAYSTGIFYQNNSRYSYLRCGTHAGGGWAVSGMAIPQNNAYDIMCTGAFVGGGSADSAGNNSRVVVNTPDGKVKKALSTTATHASWNLRTYKTNTTLLQVTDYEQYISGCTSNSSNGATNRESYVAILIGIKLPVNKYYIF